MARVNDKPSCQSGWTMIGLFVLSTLVLSLLFSVVAHPWLTLPLWMVFRRCVSIAAAISVWWITTRLEHRAIRSYGFVSPPSGLRQFLFGILLGVVSLGVLLALGLATGVCRVHAMSDHTKVWWILVGFLPASVLVGILEELVFRGFLLQHLARCSMGVAVVASSAAYSLVHLKTTAVGLLRAQELVGLFILGTVLALSYLRTHQLYMAVGLHAVLAYGARVNKLVLELPNQSLSWLVGTNRLINGVASWVVLLTVAAVIVRWTQPRAQGGADGTT